MKRLLIILGFPIGDPFYWEPSPWVRLRLWANRKLRRAPNATCNACGYGGVRTRRRIWCPACWEDEGGELILDAADVEIGRHADADR